MNKLIEEQLKKVKVASLDDYDAHTHTYHIKKYVAKETLIGHCYSIAIDESLLRQDSNEILRLNWNKGTVPTGKKMNVEIEKKMGHMVYVSGVSADTNKMWEGWLPDNQFTILEDITV